MADFKIIGLSAPAGFPINDHLKEIPANKILVSKIEKQITKYIKSCYPKGAEPIYSEWYTGMTDISHNRYNAHKKQRKIKRHWENLDKVSIKMLEKVKVTIKDYKFSKPVNNNFLYLSSISK